MSMRSNSIIIHDSYMSENDPYLHAETVAFLEHERLHGKGKKCKSTKYRRSRPQPNPAKQDGNR